MSDVFSPLERTILKAKGLTEEQLGLLESMGVTSRGAFETIGDAGTLREVSGIDAEVAERVMTWAVGAPAAAPAGGEGGAAAVSPPAAVTINDPSVVLCTNCQHKQPHDYKTGDLCPNCGRQAEPMSNCYWCHATGSGKFCRSCGAGFVKNLDYEIAVLLKREGVAKAKIAAELEGMDDAEKETRLTQLRSGRY